MIEINHFENQIADHHNKLCFLIWMRHLKLGYQKESITYFTILYRDFL